MKARGNMHFGAVPTIFFRSRWLRNNPTKAERLLWKHLRQRQMEGIKFRRQHPLYNYILDFYSNELKLCIELDGDHHNESLKSLEDESRDATLKGMGIVVIRFSNEQVILNTEGTLEEIRRCILRLMEFN